MGSSEEVWRAYCSSCWGWQVVISSEEAGAGCSLCSALAGFEPAGPGMSVSMVPILLKDSGMGWGTFLRSFLRESCLSNRVIMAEFSYPFVKFPPFLALIIYVSIYDIHNVRVHENSCCRLEHENLGCCFGRDWSCEVLGILALVLCGT